MYDLTSKPFFLLSFPLICGDRKKKSCLLLRLKDFKHFLLTTQSQNMTSSSSSIFNLGNLISRAHFIVSLLLQQEVEEPLPPHPLQNGTARDAERPLMTSPTTSLAPPTELSPTSGNKSSTLSPMMPKKLQTSEKGGFKGFSRRLSKRGGIVLNYMLLLIVAMKTSTILGYVTGFDFVSIHPLLCCKPASKPITILYEKL